MATACCVSAGSTTYAQDRSTALTAGLAAPLSQVLSDGSTSYLYGHQRLAALGQSWYVGDALGSVRQTLDGSGAVLAATGYSPWGVPQQPLTTLFGFTGELQQQDRVQLRARWYDPGNGTFTSRDPFAGFPTQPYSLHPYQYAYSAPTTWTDPTGLCVAYGNDFCAGVTSWAIFATAFPFEYNLPVTPSTFAEAARAGGMSLRTAAEMAASYDVVRAEPWRYPREGQRFIEAEAFATYFLGFSLVRALDTDTGALLQEQAELYRQEALCDGLTDAQSWRLLEVNALIGAVLGADEVVGQSGFRSLDNIRGPKGLRFANGGGGKAVDRARRLAQRTSEDARSGKVREASGYHGRLPRSVEQETLANPDAVYLSEGTSRRFVFRRNGDVVITEGLKDPSSRGRIVTSYGPSGPRGASGASALGESPDTPGLPVTHDMIVDGSIPLPSGEGFVPPAIQIIP